MRLLVVNSGSSSLKLSLVEGGRRLDDKTVERWDAADDRAIGQFARPEVGIDAVVHRVVHGGLRFRQAVFVDAEVVDQLKELAPLAPLHQGRALDAIRAASQVIPDVPVVACFDTAFHSTIPAVNYTYALPAEWMAKWPLRRFGFHGLSHSYAANRAPAVAGGAGRPRHVSCHLGSGASLCAIAQGKSIATTMGFSPLEGLVMGTRSGSVDPGLILWLINQAGLVAQEVEESLTHRAGLAGLSGTSGDMRDVLGRAEQGEAASRLAVDVYVARLVEAVAVMAAALGGLDLLSFTGGVGEHVSPIRARVAEGLAFLGVAVDEGANGGGPDCDITAESSSAAVVVIAAGEDLQMASEAEGLLGRDG